MGFGFKQPLVGEKRCVTTLITAAEETTEYPARFERQKSPAPAVPQRSNKIMQLS